MQGLPSTPLTKPKSPRQQRVAAELRDNLALVLQHGEVPLDNAEHIIITISDVSISPDLRQGDVFFTALGGSTDIAEAALRRQAKALSFAATKRMGLRLVPQLRFLVDTRQHNAQRIEYLLRSPHVARDLSAPDA